MLYEHYYRGLSRFLFAKSFVKLKTLFWWQKKNDETLFFFWRNLSWFGAKSDFQNQYPAVWDKLLRPAVRFDGKNSNKLNCPPDFHILELLTHYVVEQITNSEMYLGISFTKLSIVRLFQLLTLMPLLKLSLNKKGQTFIGMLVFSNFY